MNNLFKFARYNKLLVGLPQRSRILTSQVPINFPKVQTIRFTQTKRDDGKHDDERQQQQQKPNLSEDIPLVKFKTYDVKKIFKEFYSLYGPLFIVCHIGVSLTSLGIFSTIVWFNIDPLSYMPDYFVERIGSTALQITGGSGKFVIAYTIHKVILPVRLGLAVYLTRALSGVFKKKKQ